MYEELERELKYCAMGLRGRLFRNRPKKYEDIEQYIKDIKSLEEHIANHERRMSEWREKGNRLGELSHQVEAAEYRSQAIELYKQLLSEYTESAQAYDKDAVTKGIGLTPQYCRERALKYWHVANILKTRVAQLTAAGTALSDTYRAWKAELDHAKREQEGSKQWSHNNK